MAVSGNTVTLTLASNVAQGDSVTVSYVKPSGGPLRNVICEDAPSFSDMSVTVGPAVSVVAVTSDAGDDNTYGLGFIAGDPARTGRMARRRGDSARVFRGHNT